MLVCFRCLCSPLLLCVTDGSERTNRLGRLMAMTYFGQFLGSLIYGIMIELTLVRNIFIFALVINGLSIVVIITFLQDSLADKTTSVIVCKLNMFGSLHFFYRCFNI